MILDHINNLENYAGSSIYAALKQIQTTDFSALEDITYEVDGRNLYFFINSYATWQDNQKPEAHKKYIDIQYMIRGSEKMGVGQLENMEAEVEARHQNDIWFYQGPMDYITVKEGMFAVFYPNDAHAPCISPDGQGEAVRKAVFKVHI